MRAEGALGIGSLSRPWGPVSHKAMRTAEPGEPPRMAMFGRNTKVKCIFPPNHDSGMSLPSACTSARKVSEPQFSGTSRKDHTGRGDPAGSETRADPAPDTAKSTSPRRWTQQRARHPPPRLQSLLSLRGAQGLLSPPSAGAGSGWPRASSRVGRCACESTGPRRSVHGTTEAPSAGVAAAARQLQPPPAPAPTHLRRGWRRPSGHWAPPRPGTARPQLRC